jgi:hypothetical protein
MHAAQARRSARRNRNEQLVGRASGCHQSTLLSKVEIGAFALFNKNSLAINNTEPASKEHGMDAKQLLSRDAVSGQIQLCQSR